jgi:NAD-dependent dihydropyrimidine dehydrogenase PreA subunit
VVLNPIWDIRSASAADPGIPRRSGQAARRRSVGRMSLMNFLWKTGSIGESFEERVNGLFLRNRGFSAEWSASFSGGRKMFEADLRSESRIRNKTTKTAVVDYDLCLCCGACVAVCPADALFLNGAHLELKDACTGCGSCAKICPIHALPAGERVSP